MLNRIGRNLLVWRVKWTMHQFICSAKAVDALGLYNCALQAWILLLHSVQIVRRPRVLLMTLQGLASFEVYCIYETSVPTAQRGSRNSILQTAQWRLYELEVRAIVIQFPTAARYFSLLKSGCTGSGAHAASFLVGHEGLLPPGYKSRGVKLTIHPSLIPRLRVDRNTTHPPMWPWNAETTFTFISRGFLVGRDVAVGIATRYGLDGPGIEPRGGEIFICPQRPWGPPSLLYNGYNVFFQNRAAGAWR